MNWLAHVFLSEQKIDFQIGNFLADPLKAKLWTGASTDIHKGLTTHLKIDSFTDSHLLFSKSKSRLRKKGLLKAVIIDLTYDYLLTKNWSLFCNISLEEFLKEFNMNAYERSFDLPAKAQELVKNLAANNRLNNYHTLEQLEKSFLMIDRRLSPRLLKRETASSYINEVINEIDNIEKDFMEFFPLLCSHIKKNLDTSYLSHWNNI